MSEVWDYEPRDKKPSDEPPYTSQWYPMGKLAEAEFWYDETQCWLVRKDPITGKSSAMYLPPLRKQIWCQFMRRVRYYASFATGIYPWY